MNQQRKRINLAILWALAVALSTPPILQGSESRKQTETERRSQPPLHDGALSRPDLDPAAQLRYIKLLSDTKIHGGLEDLLRDNDRSILLHATRSPAGTCSTAVVFGFEVGDATAISAFVAKYRAPAATKPAVVALIDPIDGDTRPLLCDQPWWRSAGVLPCKVPSDLVPGGLGPLNLLEVILIVEVHCAGARGDDAVAVTTVRLGPPPTPPPT
jgi:hypothetical protein